MRRRFPNPLPLMIGLSFAAAVHLAAAAPVSRWLTAERRPPGAADLRVENTVVPDDLLRLDDANLVSFDVVNRGVVPIQDTAWEDRVYLSQDDELDADDKLLIVSPRAGSLRPNERYRSGAHALHLPEGVTPPFYLLFQTDARDTVDERWMEDNNVYARRFDPLPDDEPPQVAVGRPDAPRRVTVAWISHDDFRELIAPASETEQPMVQSAVDPVDAAPLEADPTPPAAPSPQPPAPAQTPAEAGGSLADASSDTEPTAPPAPAEDDPAVAHAPDPGPPTPAQPDLQTAAGEGDAAVDAAPAGSSDEARPTRAPRDEGEADPAVRYPRRIDVQPGGTVVGEGIEITTARPDFDAVARASTLPNDVEAELVFDGTGTVIEARITTSSGSANIDAPIARSLYRWKAAGPQIDSLKGTLILPVRIILN